ncbi:Protein Iojap-related [Hibiscus syriacus]|uniref:Protein Iojap-related n=1 Tax=Hibiscus syriacus TaxID=106335 RepID=A0A6A3BKI4_HIBSY|nr:Protein Iojap-related [Hibiscus syriacus]
MPLGRFHGDCHQEVPWHVKNIAQALIYKVKQKQKGAKRMVLPSVQGQETGKWIVIDSGRVIVHTLDEKARTYYNLEYLDFKDNPEGTG